MPRNKRKHPVSRYERLMLAAINSLPFTFHSPGEPNIPETVRYEAIHGEEGLEQGGTRYHVTSTQKRETLTPTKQSFKYTKKVKVRRAPKGSKLN